MPVRTPQSKPKTLAKPSPAPHIGFTGKPVKEQSVTVRRVPLGFNPAQTTTQVEIAR